MAINQRKAGALLTYGYIFANLIVILLYQPIMMRILGQAEYGLYSLILSISGYLSVFDLGLGSAIVVFSVKYRAMGKPEAEQQLLGLIKRVFNIIAVIVFALGTLIALLLPAFFSGAKLKPTAVLAGGTALAVLKIFKEALLLLFIKVLYFVEIKQYAVLAEHSLGLSRHRLHVRKRRSCGVKTSQLHAGVFGKDCGAGGLTRAGRAVEYHRRQSSGLRDPSEDAVFSNQVLLSCYFIK